MKIHVNGLNLNYETYGAGRPLILLHGNGETHKIFDRAIPLLEKMFTVYAIDSRGHGESDAASAYHYADMTEDVRCFIEEKKLEKPILYGFSDGGIIGLLLASAYPELLSTLIVSGANTSPNGIRPGWLKFFRWLSTRVRDPKMDMMLVEPDITPEMLQKIAVPTLVLAGGHDMVSRADTEKIAANIKNSTLRIMRFYGHGGYIVHRKKIAELITEFVERACAAD